MSIDLNKEAEQSNGYSIYGKPLGGKYLAFNEGFVAGANSKYVQAKIIQAQIDENNSVLQMLNVHGNEASKLRVVGRIETLQKQLKQLQNK